MSIETAIKSFGLTRLANAMGESVQCIHNWRKRGVPLERVPEIEAITGVMREQLRPDIDWTAFCRRPSKRVLNQKRNALGTS